MAENLGRSNTSLQPESDATEPSSELRRAIEQYANNRDPANVHPLVSQLANLDDTAARGAIRATITQARERAREIQQEHQARLDEPLSEVVGFRDRLRSEVYTVATNIRRSRPRMMESSRYLERHRRLAETFDLHPPNESYNAARQHMRALLDVQDYLADGARGNGAKRRKIDNGTSISGFPGFSYGHYGQVEPGKLRMEIESCDGGTYSLDWCGDSSVDSSAYSAANVLKNDDSVYCTKGNRCNLVLRHQGATPFCLTELIIKGPPRHYTDPVQEGMIFISMTSDDLLTRTAQYQIKPAPLLRRTGVQVNRDPNNEHIVSIRHDNNVMTGVYNHEQESGGGNYGRAQIPPEFGQNAPPFHVTTECSDSDSDSSPLRRRRARTDRLGRPLLDVDDDYSSDSDSSSRNHEWHGTYLSGGQSFENRPSSSSSRRPERRSVASNISIGLAEAKTAADEVSEEAIKAVGGGLMSPHACFFIERDKSKCSIKFDPPVSGRFVLLKLWSPNHTEVGNIDIQSIVCKGFAGPRFFPASQLR